jgi:HPt (histidine-containing phosphotransfer) domain-containing protein
MTSVQENFAHVKTSALLSSLWLRIRPIIEERLEVIERAAAAATTGSLDVDTREEAADVAHKLAGSLGMYGYDSGTRLARQLELLLDYSKPDPVQLQQLAIALRKSLTFPNPE